MPSPEPIRVDLTLDPAVPIPDELTESSLADLISYVLEAEGAGGTWEVGIRFVDDSTMQRAHRDFMGIDAPTDIMTFPYEPDEFGIDPGEASAAGLTQGGDILISVDSAAANARDAGWDVATELRFLVVHGMLHLLDWDDASAEDREAMLARQAELLRSWTADRRS